MSVERAFGRLKKYYEYLTVKELDAELQRMASRKLVELSCIGKSAEGRQILCAKAGSGKRNAVVFGFPHSNETVGSLMCLELLRLVPEVKELSQFTWYVVPCADPDGAALNEGWFKGKFTIKRYIDNFYRSRSEVQTDWSFPVKYKDYNFNTPPPHVKALAGLIKKTKPHLVFPIHNAGIGGAYFFVSRKMPDAYYKEVVSLCKTLNVPLNMGEPEDEFMVELKRPFYLDPSFVDYYKYYKRLGKDPKKDLHMGTTSVAYAKSHNRKAFGMVGEVPYIWDDRIGDNTPTGMRRRDELLERIHERESFVDTLEHVLKCKGINKKSPFYGTEEWLLRQTRRRIDVDRRDLESGKYKKRATVAEKFSSEVLERFYEVLALGEVRRLLLESKDCTEEHDVMRRVNREIDAFVKKLEKEGEPRILPIDDLIKIQLGFLLISIKYLS